jgi:hypothetical protein
MRNGGVFVWEGDGYIEFFLYLCRRKKVKSELDGRKEKR